MNWIDLVKENQIEDIKQKSFEKAQVIFKHSIRCSISSMAKGRLERAIKPDNADFYFLDLINYRSISNKVATFFDVYHESPQILVIRNGECIYNESHGAISMDDIHETVA